MSKTIDDLYKHLFKALEDLENKKIDPHQANAAANLGQSIVNAGKLECQFLDTVGGKATGFMPAERLPSPDQLHLVNRMKTRVG